MATEWSLGALEIDDAALEVAGLKHSQQPNFGRPSHVPSSQHSSHDRAMHSQPWQAQPIFRESMRVDGNARTSTDSQASRGMWGSPPNSCSAPGHRQVEASAHSRTVPFPDMWGAEPDAHAAAHLHSEVPSKRPRLNSEDSHVTGGSQAFRQNRPPAHGCQVQGGGGNRAGAKLQGLAWGSRAEDEYDEAAILMRCQEEGPPGPAGGSLALPGWHAKDKKTSATSRGVLLSDSIGWLCALKFLKLPFDAFHLGAGGPRVPNGSHIMTQNLAAVAQQASPQRWDLAVVVQRVELVAGEIDVIVSDPTCEMGATVDRRVAMTWPRAACEGTALLLSGVISVRGTDLPSRLLIMQKNVVRHFAPGDITPEESEALIACARVSLVGTR